MPWLVMSPDESATQTIIVSATAESLEAFFGLLESFYATFGVDGLEAPSLWWQNCLTTAVLEIGGNVVRHAYPGSNPVGDLSLSLHRYSDRVEACLRDRGVAFVPRPERPETSL